MKPLYNSDGRNTVFCGKTIIAKMYVGNEQPEMRILQGMNRSETVKQIIKDCPEFAIYNNITESYYPKLF
jgi:hypothetical protein